MFKINPSLAHCRGYIVQMSVVWNVPGNILDGYQIDITQILQWRMLLENQVNLIKIKQ